MKNRCTFLFFLPSFILLCLLQAGCSQQPSFSQQQSSKPETASNVQPDTDSGGAEKDDSSKRSLEFQSDSRAGQLLKKLRDPEDTSIMVVSHRGNWHEFPENSLAAIESCIEHGVDMLEIDIRPTRDGQYVLMHDKTLERSTTGQGKVSHYSVQQLKQFRLNDKNGNPTEHTIPTLEEALAVCHNKILVYLDKSEYDMPNVHKLVLQSGLNDQVFFYGRSPLVDLKQTCGAQLNSLNYFPKVGQGTPEFEEYIHNFLTDNRPDAFIFDFQTEQAAVLQLIPEIRSKGTRCWASPLWDTLAGGHTDELALDNPDAHWGWLIDQGFTMICTDCPVELLKYLRGKGLHD